MSHSASGSPAKPWPFPWRSARLGYAVAFLAVAAGVPIFLRMPPWCDLTLYDVAARNILGGGVHYRDVFDTNTPGFVWLLSLIRWLFGWSVEAVRVVDLLIVSGIVVVLDRFAAAGGASRGARAWTLAAVALFYLFQSEFIHAQRDVWMLLPSVVAVGLRFRRLATAEQSPLRRATFRAAMAEGVLWGLAVWIKPHVVVPAAVVWLLTFRWCRHPVCDLIGQFVGGICIGALGIGYLVQSGTWPHFIDVFTTWNTGYFETMMMEFRWRVNRQLVYFPPFSFLQVLSLPVAAITVLAGRPWATHPEYASPGPRCRWLRFARPITGRIAGAWSWCARLWNRLKDRVLGNPRRFNPRSYVWDPGTSDRVRFARMVLAAIYLGWTAQALFLQRDFHYVHAPEILMLLFLLATQRWAAGAFLTAWLCVSSFVVIVGWETAANVTGVGPDGGPEWAVLHPALDLDRMKQWPECWRTGLTPQEERRRMDAVALVHGFHGVNDWDQLGEASDWLAAKGVKDGEVVGWHDSTHAVYLILRIQPGFRFQHVSHISGLGPDQTNRVNEEFDREAPHVRYVISDLMRVAADGKEYLDDITAPGPNFLPPGLHPAFRDDFPYTEPAVFRSKDGRGRYIIHELRHPFTRPPRDS